MTYILINNFIIYQLYIKNRRKPEILMKTFIKYKIKE